MEHHFQVDHSRKWIMVSSAGSATVAGFRTLIEDLMNPPYMELPYAILSDFSELDFSTLDAGAIRDIMAFLLVEKDKVVPVKHAIVAGSELAFGFARMYQMMAQDVLPLTTKVFGTVEEAERWLDE